MIAELIGKVGIFFLELFITDRKKKQEYAKRIKEAINRWDSEALKSSELRDMFDRIEAKMKDDKDAV